MVCFQHGIYRFKVDPDPEKAVERSGLKQIQRIFSSPEFACYIPDMISRGKFPIIDVIESGGKTPYPFIMPGIGNISDN